MTDTINNQIPFVPENTIDPAAGLNLSLNTIDALLQVLVQSVGANTPPAGVEGQRFIVGTVPTGAWSGQANKLARFLDGVWQFFDARHVLNAADGLWYVRSASAWSALAGGGSGEANTASNLGAGEGLYASKDGVDLRFKSLVEGTNVTLTSDGDTVTINADGAVDSVNGQTGVVVLDAADVGAITLSESVVTTASRALVLADINTVQANTSASAHTFTIPAQASLSWPDDAELYFVKVAGGALTIAGDVGVIVNGIAANSIALPAAHQLATLKRISADLWELSGAQTPANFDMLSSLVSAEVNITGAVTLSSTAFGKMHFCAGTTADYTVGLPSAAGNAGKVIGFRMAAALTKLVSIDGNASETIDGEAVRVLWANEVAVLLCDGAAWTKIAGKSVPMSARISANAEQVIPGNTDTLVALPAVAYDKGGLTGTADALVIKRSGSYQLLGHCEFYPTAATRIYTSIRSIALNYYALIEEGGNNAQYMRQSPLYIGDISAGEAITLRVLQNGGSSLNTYYGVSQAASLQLVEIVKW